VILLYNNKPSITDSELKSINTQYSLNPNATYGDHIRNTGAFCNTSASHTYGNVLGIMEKYITDLFPENLFKTVTASTTLTSKQLNHLPHQLIKKEMPIMVLVPRISFGQEDNRFLAHTLINERRTNTQSFWGAGNLLELGKDIKNKIYIHGHYNRALMFIDIVLSFNTYAEQVSWMSYIHNMIPVGHNQYIHAPLELYIPYDFTYLISNLSKVEINKNNSVYDFMTYMNSIFYYPITYKLKSGSNTDEFFMYYNTDIDTTIMDVQAGNGVKDGQIRRAFDITFTMRCEFNTVGYFMLNSPDIKKRVNISEVENLAISTIFSDVININDFDLPVGWTILCWPIFKLKEHESTMSIDSILNDSLRAVIDHHLKFGIPMERFIRIQFRENGNILTEENYYIDWKLRVLHIMNPNYRRTYRLLVSVSHEYINNLIKELYNLE